MTILEELECPQPANLVETRLFLIVLVRFLGTKATLELGILRIPHATAISTFSLASSMSYSMINLVNIIFVISVTYNRAGLEFSIISRHPTITLQRICGGGDRDLPSLLH